MDIILKSSTGGVSAKKDALEFGRAAARVCYSKFDFDSLLGEEDKRDLIGTTLKAGHHSPYEHPHLTFYFESIPKFGAMILNNERPYVTSEKSARYTKMQLDGLQKELYDKWSDIFETEIKRTYDFLDEVKVKKLAQENARYLTSVFTPTKMLHTLSFRQLNHLMHWFDDFVSSAPDNGFNNRVKSFMKEFNTLLQPFYEERIDPVMKKRRLRIFSARKDHPEEFGENYSTTYKISYAGLAQAHRHRTLNYEIVDNNTQEFFVPPIIKDKTELSGEWLSDLEKVAYDFPQGTLIKVHEFGNYEDFLSKAAERMCGHAQWEIMDQTRKTMELYAEKTKDSNPELYSLLSGYINGPKCTFPDINCPEPCPFGPKKGLDRLI
ncbi:MAG: FAD-dependent thymidylate synthase [Candidatus Woesearchaeota archaeon]